MLLDDEEAATPPLPAARATLLVFTTGTDDDDEDEDEEAFDDEEDDDDLEVDLAETCDEEEEDEEDEEELEEDEDADAVGRPTGTPSPALIESMRLVYEVVAMGTMIEGLGKLATEPPFHRATVSSPTRWSVAPPRLTLRNWWWFCLSSPSCDWATTVLLVEESRKSNTELTSVVCIVEEVLLKVWLSSSMQNRINDL